MIRRGFRPLLLVLVASCGLETDSATPRPPAEATPQPGALPAAATGVVAELDASLFWGAPDVVEPTIEWEPQQIVVEEAAIIQDCALVDVDGDSDLDLFLAVCGDWQNSSRDPLEHFNSLLLNDGRGAFLTVTAGALTEDAGGWMRCAWTDIDDDADLDVFVFNAGVTRHGLYRNLGDARFERIDVPAFTRSNAGNPYSSAACTWGDIEGDGDPDLLLCDEYGLTAYANDGSGRLALWPDLASFAPNRWPGGRAIDGAGEDLDLADYDDDGDLDLLMACWLADRNPLLANDGAGHFIEVVPPPFSGEFVEGHACRFIDVDLDSDLDALLVNYRDTHSRGNDEVYRNDGPSGWVRVPDAIPDDQRSADVALADLDGDGDLDALFANSPNAECLVGLNARDGTFRLSRIAPPPGHEWLEASSCAAGDIDGDGDFDGVFAERNSVTLLINAGRVP